MTGRLKQMPPASACQLQETGAAMKIDHDGRLLFQEARKRSEDSGNMPLALGVHIYIVCAGKYSLRENLLLV